MKKISESTLRKIEWFVAIAITGFCASLHFIFMMNAGGLWRDEAAAINVSQMPLKEAWNQLYYELFPMFWVCVARFWGWVGMGTDFGYRVLGCLTGLLVLGAIWFVARSLKLRFPLILLIVFALNPLVIVYGDSMRPWGWGLLWMIVETALVWLVLENPTPWRTAAAALGAIAAVQSSYYNSLLLLALGLAALIVAGSRGKWGRGWLIIGIGALAGVTMLPYLRFFMAGGSKYSSIRTAFSLTDFVEKLIDAVSGKGPFRHEVVDLRVWWGLVLLSALVLLLCLLRPQRMKRSDLQDNLLLFCVAIFFLAVPAYFIFLYELKFATSPWYYLSLMLAGGIALEAILCLLENSMTGRWIRLGTVMIVLLVVGPSAWWTVRLRMTNTDLVAAKLKTTATARDLVVVNPCYYSISFAREYSGAAPWVPLPRVVEKVHRYDILGEMISHPDRTAAIQDVLDEMSSTLKSGGRIWLISEYHLKEFKKAPPAPINGIPDEFVKVKDYWWRETSYFLDQHSLHREPVRIAAPTEVCTYEDVKVDVVSGWKEK